MATPKVNRLQRVVLTGGGTGGHLYPALAVADALRDNPAVEALLYVGNRNSLEERRVTEAGYPFSPIAFFGMPRQVNPLAWSRWLAALWQSVNSSMQLLQTFQATVVLGTGGYVAGPVLLAAKRLGIPYCIHEPDAHPGLVNRLMAPHAAWVTGAFPQAQQLLKTSRFTVTGNPLRGLNTQLTKAEALQALRLDWPAEQPVLVVTGGSQGARTLNRALVQALPVLLEEMGLAVIHQTGEKLFDETLMMVDPALHDHPRYCVQPFYTAMAPVWRCADLAVCRAGSLTLSELYAYGVASILVPFPFAAADHQRKNAKASVAAGASWYLEDANCTGQALLAMLQQLGKGTDALTAMQQAAQALAQPQATDNVVTVLLDQARQPLD